MRDEGAASTQTEPIAVAEDEGSRPPTDPRPHNRFDDVVEDPRVRKVAGAVGAVLLYYFVIQLFWPSPIGVMLQGVVIGGLTALISLGIAFVYRANRIVNFAAGGLGAIPASLAVLLIVGPGVPYVLALPTGLAAAVVLGAMIEFLLIRRFFEAPRLILTVVTIGISLGLSGFGFILPSLFDIDTPPQDYPSPFEFEATIGKTVFHGDEVVALIAVVGCIFGLLYLLRRTDMGIAIRSSAESMDRTALLGVPVRRINTVVWVIATVLSFIAVFLRAGIIGLPFGELLGPSILVRALAAAVIGRMERFNTILVAAVGLGVLESAVIFSTQSGAVIVDAIIFVVIIVALLAQKQIGTAREEEESSWQTATDVRPIPRELARLPEIRWGRWGLVGALLALGLLFPTFGGIGRVSFLSTLFTLSIVGVSLVILSGWAGQVSLGQVAFYGIGAAVGGFLTSQWGWDLSLAILAAGLAGAAAAMVIGLPALRIKGLFLAVTTLSFALATSSYLLNESLMGWLPTDRFARPMLFNRITLDSETRYYYFALAALLLAIAAVRALRRSRTGRVLIGVRENERAAQSYGVSAVGAKLTAFAISGFLASFAGAIFVHHQQVLGTQPFAVDRSLAVFIMVVVGGLGSVLGGIVGVFLIQGTTFFATVFPETLRDLLDFLLGSVGVIVILLIFRGGLAEAIYGVRDRILRYVADRRGIIVPSLVADVREDSEAAERAGKGPDLDLDLFDTAAERAGRAADEPGDTEPSETVEGAR